MPCEEKKKKWARSTHTWSAVSRVVGRSMSLWICIPSPGPMWLMWLKFEGALIILDLLSGFLMWPQINKTTLAKLRRASMLSRGRAMVWLFDREKEWKDKEWKDVFVFLSRGSNFSVAILHDWSDGRKFFTVFVMKLWVGKLEASQLQLCR